LPTLTINQPRIERKEGRVTVSSLIHTQDEDKDLWFRGPADALSVTGADAFLIAMLTTAMRRRLHVVVEADISPKLLAATSRIQDILCSWYPELSRIVIEAPARTSDPVTPATGTAAFFSGGVDSFYSAFKHLEQIDALVLVHGFDMPLANLSLRARASESLARAARLLGKSLVEVETNSRELTNLHVSWTYHQFGPGLASVAVLLGGCVGKVFVPASETYAHLDPCGSHPLLDPLWSTETVVVEYDGGEATRNQKVAVIAQHPEILPMLRVCWENRDNNYNCGRCEKCIRTMIHLQAAGVMDKCSFAFDAPLRVEEVERMAIPNELVFFHAIENLRLIELDERNGDLARALRHAISRYEAERAVSSIANFPIRNWLPVAKVLAGKVYKRLRRR
jgi:hypothetical protein